MKSPGVWKGFESISHKVLDFIVAQGPGDPRFGALAVEWEFFARRSYLVSCKRLEQGVNIGYSASSRQPSLNQGADVPMEENIAHLDEKPAPATNSSGQEDGKMTVEQYAQRMALGESVPDLVTLDLTD